MNLQQTKHLAFRGLALLGILIWAIGSYCADSDELLQPPGLRLLNEPTTVIPATYHYINQKLALPPYRSATGTPLKGWTREFIKTRRFSSDQSAWIYYRSSDLKRTQFIQNTGRPDSLRIWPVGTTLVLEGYKGDAYQVEGAKLIEILVMTKMAPKPAAATHKFFPVDWSYARYTPDGNWSLTTQKLIECHQCHSIAFQLTGDLVFTQFP
jgi:hypothetical protein